MLVTLNTQNNYVLQSIAYLGFKFEFLSIIHKRKCGPHTWEPNHMVYIVAIYYVMPLSWLNCFCKTPRTNRKEEENKEDRRGFSLVTTKLTPLFD